jgi:hypothetical protein
VPTFREIGGDFETPTADLLTSPCAPPWELRYPDSPVVYVESGRQGLTAIAHELEEEGRRRLLVPAHFCDSMLEPFLARGWQVLPLAVGDDLFPVQGVVQQILEAPGTTVALHAPYFGQDTPAHVKDDLAVARGRGVKVIVDETHRPLSPSEFPADFRIASLRKTLPLFDGAYVVGLAAPRLVGPERTRTTLSGLRAAAMRSKDDYLRDGGDATVHLDAFREADRIVADGLVPRPMSGESRALLARLRYAEIGRRRRQNARLLVDGLRALDLRVLFDPSGSSVVPSHVVLVVDQPRALQHALAARGIFCPIHWARPATVEMSVWADRLLSLPIDQRYGPDDINQVVAALQASLLRELSVTSGATTT